MSEPIEDYIVLTVPDDAVLDDLMILRLNTLADLNVADQYPEGRRPRAIVLEPTKWLVTSDWQEVERHQPAHQCPACRAGNDQAIAFLKEFPTKRLALGNLRYQEIW